MTCSEWTSKGVRTAASRRYHRVRNASSEPLSAKRDILILEDVKISEVPQRSEEGEL